MIVENIDAQLWLVCYDPNLVLSNSALSVLGHAQIARAQQFVGGRKLEFLLGRLLLINALKAEVAVNGAGNAWSIAEREGQPPLVSCESMSVATSISHSKNRLGVLSAQIPISSLLGLDIEFIRPTLNYQMATYFCNDEQLSKVEELGCPKQIQTFLTRLWTQKEAYFKSKEVPILNPLTKNQGFEKDNRVRSAQLADDFYLSVYCSEPVNVIPHFVNIDSDGNISEVTPESLIWDVNYSVSSDN